METILVVDDHPANREFLVTLLGYAGYRLLEAADGVQALEIVRVERPDLVIVDLVMPTMDGYEFVRQLRADPVIAHTQVLFSSATYQQSEAWSLAHAAGVRHILTKPAEPEIVLRYVAEALAPAVSISQPFSSEEFHRHHLQVLTDKLVKEVKALENEIAKRKQLEIALQQERDLLEVTLTSIGDGVIAVDLTGALTFINPVAETLTGWTLQAAKGRKLEDIFHIVDEKNRQPIENLVATVLHNGVGVQLLDDMVLLSRDGREIPVATSGAAIRSKNGQVRGVVVVFRDITERKHLEAALRCAKDEAEAADRSKSEFLSTMSHELRTPLNVILGYTELLLDDLSGAIPAQQLHMLRRIDQNSRVLTDLITTVLDLNRLEAGRLPVDVKTLRVTDLLGEVRAELQGFCDQSSLTFVWNLEEEIPAIRTDPKKLKVIVKNLLVNAIKFTGEGSVTIAAHAHNKGVEISVTDTGIGIPLEVQALIFEPFQQLDSSDTRRYGGAGLGLHIVKRLVELLRGTVTVESEVGRGSSFRVWISYG